MNHYGSFARSYAVLDCKAMDNDCREYESIRRHYLFSGLDQEEFDALMLHSHACVPGERRSAVSSW